MYGYFLAKHQNAEDLFQIEPNSGIITLTNAIPPSIPSYVLNITAYDDGSCCGGYPRLSSSSFVIIMIMDINNNNPTFPSCTYAPSVLENQPPGTRVVDVSIQLIRKNIRSVHCNHRYSIHLCTYVTVSFNAFKIKGKIHDVCFFLYLFNEGYSHRSRQRRKW